MNDIRTIAYSIFSQVWLALSLGHLYYKKGGQVTKPIILVKICYKLLYVIQLIENSFDKVTSWPQLISEFLVAHACLQCRFWLASHFFAPQVLLFSTTFRVLLLCGSIQVDATLKLNFEKPKPAIFQYRVIHQYRLCIWKLMQIIYQRSKLWQLSACRLRPFSNTFKCILQAENSMTGRAYMHGRNADTSLAEIR